MEASLFATASSGASLQKALWVSWGRGQAVLPPFVGGFFFFSIICFNGLMLVRKLSKHLCYAAPQTVELAGGEWPETSTEAGTGSSFPSQCAGTAGWAQCEVVSAVFVINFF